MGIAILSGRLYTPQGVGTFRVFGFPVTIHPSFLLIAVIGLSAGSVGDAALWAAVVFFVVLVHELGHAFAFRAYGRDASITLWGLGGLTQSRGAPLPRKQSIAVSLAGPLTQGILIGIPALYLTAHYRDASDSMSRLFSLLAFAGLGWAVLNLIPVLPLDGGRVMQQLLEGRWGAAGRRPTYLISIACAAGVGVFLYSRGYYTSAFLLPGFLIMMNIREMTTVRDVDEMKRLAEGHAAVASGDVRTGRATGEEVLAGARSDRVRAAAIDLIAWTHFASGDRAGATSVLARLPNGTDPSRFSAAYVMLLDGLQDAAVAATIEGFLQAQPVPPNQLLTARLADKGLIDRVVEPLFASSGEIGPRAAWAMSQQLHSMERFEAAARLSARAYQDGRVERSVQAYNAACSLARAGYPNEAGQWLVAAAQQGFTDRAKLESDSDLASLRYSDAFRQARMIMDAALQSPRT
jgi:Zn-dependent protease